MKIETLHLIFKTVHIQCHGVHTKTPMEVSSLTAFSESLTLCHCRVGHQFLTGGLTRNKGSGAISGCCYEHTVGFLFTSLSLFILSSSCRNLHLFHYSPLQNHHIQTTETSNALSMPYTLTCINTKFTFPQESE